MAKKQETWKQDAEWWGNPSLGLQSHTKRFANYHQNNRMVPVTIFGNPGDWSFCVNAGADSDFSYTGSCLDCQTIEEAKAYVDDCYTRRSLFI
jgi:hypothetical protein